MTDQPPAPSRSAALGLAGIVAAACGVSLVWVFAVPIYQSPDEPAHLDYALAIHAHSHPFLAQNTSFNRLPTSAHPYTPYLQLRTNTFEISFSPGAKVDPWYGTAEYFAAVDRDAPPAPHDVAGPSQLAAIYPFGYYTLLAGWIGLVRLFTDSLTVTFFAARIFSVVLLAVTLIATYGTIRLLEFSQRFALLLTAGIGLLPLTSFVSSYVQPDNLSWTLVSAAYYFSLRGRRDHWPLRSLVPLGLVLAGLAITKAQFFVCTTGPVGALLGTDLIRERALFRRWLTAAVAVLLPPIVLGSVYVWTVWGTENYFGTAGQAGIPRCLSYLGRAMRDFFWTGSHRSFWGTFGWGDTPLVIGKYRTNLWVHVILHVFSLATLALTVVGIAKTVVRLARLFRKHRLGLAIRLAVGNPVVNSLLVFTAVITILFVRTENRFAAQGRNWLPVILPAFLLGIAYAPRALSWRRPRWAYSTVALTGLLAYDAVGGYYALKCVNERFYLPFASVPTHRTSLPTEPLETHRALQANGAWEMSGADSYLGYAIDPPGFVHGIRLEFRVSKEERGRYAFRVTWRTGEEPPGAPPRSALFCPMGSEVARGVTIWTNGPVRDFRIYPDDRPCQFEVRAVSVLH
jgi:hypothetical protein